MHGVINQITNVPLYKKDVHFWPHDSYAEKQDKRLANRAYRRLVKHGIKTDKEIRPIPREVSNVWSFGKDGMHDV